MGERVKRKIQARIMILVTGAAGQLGTDVVLELKRRGIDHLGIDIAELDITDFNAAAQYMREKKPSCIIHCAAYAKVDDAEDNAELCMRINADSAENIAKSCREINAEMIYISTDYVFNGEGETPYEINAPKEPLSVYGKSKLLGEEAVMRHLEKHYIVRTSWLFGRYGNNFVKTMLNLSHDRAELNVVNDQIGSPTYTLDLAALLCNMAFSGRHGIYHATNEGFCAWAEFAAEIMRLSGSLCKVNPIASEQYPAKAVRPKNSRLSKASLDEAGFAKLPDWKDALNRYMTGYNWE